jgi:epoxyqueuosine reductase
VTELGSITEVVLTAAQQCGFDAAGIAPVPTPDSAEDLQDRQRYAAWIASGSAGEMEYLKRRNDGGDLLRSSLRVPFPWARSVIVCAVNYETAEPHSIAPAPPGSAWIARYAWTSHGDRPSDYHKVLLKRLKTLDAALHATLGPYESRAFVDTGPVVERIFARYAGVGWVGKNTCILNQKLGSWLFLGVIVTSLDISAERPLEVSADRCGSCRRCIEACPTNALTPYQMDATRCISYLTIEKRGRIDDTLRQGIGRQVFGCDICQDVCPWNRRAPIGGDPDLRPRRELVNPALDWLASLDEAGFGRVFYGSPVTRTKLAGLRRNVAIAMGNSGDPQYLQRLEEWSHSEDETLAEAAHWALGRIRSGA